VLVAESNCRFSIESRSFYAAAHRPLRRQPPARREQAGGLADARRCRRCGERCDGGEGVPEAKVQEAGKRVSRRRQPARFVGQRRAGAGSHEQGSGTFERTIPRAHGPQGVLGDREYAPDPPTGELVDWLKKDEKKQRMGVVSRHTIGAQRAKLAYRTIEAKSSGCLVEVELETGRKHQIRLQLAAAGCPILGDRKYGSRMAFPGGIALHAHELTIEHPTTKQPMRFEAPPPEAFAKHLAKK
jgi:hypothetical protein